MKKIETTEINYNFHENCDSVMFTKSIKVKVTQIHLKNDTKFKNIWLTNNPMEIHGKGNRTSLILKTASVKKK